MEEWVGDHLFKGDELDLGSIQLADVIDINFLQRLQDDFAKGVGVASVTVDLEGNPITKPSSYTRFCMDFTHATECGDKRCAESHRNGGKMAARLGKPVVYECHAGLIDFAAPIILEGRQIGTILGGQVLTEAPNEEKYRKIAREIGVDEDGYIEAVNEVRQLSRDRIEAAANVLYIVANNMSKTEYSQQKLKARSNLLSDSLDKISLAMQDLADAASFVTTNQVNVKRTMKNASAITNQINEVMLLTKNIADMIIVQKTEMARLDRLNLVGEMAASIGHEVRNPLTTVRGFLQYFSTKPEFGKYTSNLEIMIEELDRANGIITEFLSLAKNRIVERKKSDLNQIISKIIPLLQAEGMLKSIEIKLEIGDIPQLLLDEKEIRQLILNLGINAIEATGKDGIVTIVTYMRDDKPVLSIVDNGVGISQDILERIGTPFVSTKPQGTGLGLAVCYRIAERHSASIHIHSQEGIGTEVEVIFDHLCN
jgi:ligand-binding sensor protein/signal transduction histidine kinase